MPRSLCPTCKPAACAMFRRRFIRSSSRPVGSKNEKMSFFAGDADGEGREAVQPSGIASSFTCCSNTIVRSDGSPVAYAATSLTNGCPPRVKARLGRAVLEDRAHHTERLEHVAD